MNTKDLKVNKSALRFLVYGHSGTGKTTFASTFPKPYFFDFDSGMLSVRGKDIEYDSYLDNPDRPGEYDKFHRKIINLMASPGDIKTIVIDSLTSMQRTLKNRILHTNRHQTMTLPDWGAAVGELEGLFFRLLQVPIHLVVIAHEETIRDEITGNIEIRPHIIGQALPPKLPDWFDEIYRTIVIRKGREYMYRLITKAEQKFFCKSRIKVLDAEETPDFNVLMKKLERETTINAKTLSKGGKE